MAKLISKIYGEALFELAVEDGKTEEFVQELTIIRKILSYNEEFSRLMNHPKILKEEKCEVLSNVFKGRISDDLTGFLLLIVTKDRYQEIDAILDYFMMEVKRLEGIGVVSVTSAIPFNEIQKAQVKERLLTITSYKKLEMHFTVNESIIGGMIIRIGDRVVDSSVKTRLEEMQKQLLKIQV